MSEIEIRSLNGYKLVDEVARAMASNGSHGDDCLSIDITDVEQGTSAGINADTLGGKASSDYVLETELDTYKSEISSGMNSITNSVSQNTTNIANMEANIVTNYLLKTETSVNSNLFGGKAPEYYIQPRNLLDNSDFTNPVNQRGYISGANIAAYSYCIDRWRDQSGIGSTFSFDNSGALINGAISQNVDSKMILSGRTYTFAVIFADNSVLCVSGVVTTNVNSWTSFAVANDGNVRIRILAEHPEAIKLQVEDVESKRIKAATLYEGEYTAETLPPYLTKGYYAELYECQRYFQRHTFPQYATIGLAYQGPEYCFLQLPLYRNMRINSPSLTHTGGLISLGSGTYSFNGSAGNCLRATTTIGQNYTTISNPAGSCYCYTLDAVGTCFDISADL